MDYGALISEAFRISWRNKFLWVFGLFAATGSSFNLSSNTGAPPGDPGDEPPPWLEGLFRWISENLSLFFAISISLAVGLTVLYVVLSTLSRAALAESVAAIRRGETRRFGSTLRAGLRDFWRLLGLRALFLLVTLAVALVLFAPPAAFLFLYVPSLTYPPGYFPVGALVVSFFLFLLLFLLFLVLSIPIFVVAQLATRELVVGEAGVLGAFGGGFGIFRRNFGRSLLTWLIQFGIAMGTGIVLTIVLVVLGPLFFGPAIFLLQAERLAAAVVAGIVGGLIFLVPACVLSGAVGTFNHSYWTLAYLRLTSRDAGPQPVA